MATGGVLGNGTKIAYSASSPVSWNRIAQLMNLEEFLSLVADDVDTTVHSTSGLRTSMAGMTDPPEIPLMLLADLDQSSTASHEALRNYQAASGHSSAGSTIWFRVEVPVNRAQSSFRAWEFQGYVKEWTPEVPIDDKQTLRVVIKYAGGLGVYNAGASAIS